MGKREGNGTERRKDVGGYLDGPNPVKNNRRREREIEVQGCCREILDNHMRAPTRFGRACSIYSIVHNERISASAARE